MKKILIVEDNHDMQLIYRHMLDAAERRYAVEIVGSAWEAIRSLKRKKFDLIISDIVMEAMTGEAFIAAVRKERGDGALPILVITVLKEDMLERAGGMGNVHFLQKPIREKQLVRKIEEIIGA